MKTRRRYAGLSFDGRLVSQEWYASGLDPGPDMRHASIQGLGRGLELRHRCFQSIRPTIGKVLININVSSLRGSMFWRYIDPLDSRALPPTAQDLSLRRGSSASPTVCTAERDFQGDFKRCMICTSQCDYPQITQTRWLATSRSFYSLPLSPTMPSTSRLLNSSTPTKPTRGGYTHCTSSKPPEPSYRHPSTRTPRHSRAIVWSECSVFCNLCPQSLDFGSQLLTLLLPTLPL
ncbi:hypothetical protein M405DRAFT_302474 [Rhizopogon salebrosus TDB-379]|nr:hypothetical protein M405DRAFT_302474 [Rhizopogon salebrosus TDB-379]